ncbi:MULTISPECIES: cold-shock protein [Lactobacillaceae]|uniref:Cold shock domain-containing protein n=1 Tax=Limosilactobacillus alvi TaxID=990412 RepID=A0ABS2EM37_9LACO|nr:MULTISPECIES: cold shock domain-containing protein [Lactobacillaceae]MBM6753563.1 cold shock domain-containing protein [Limosilactobacillus alvi]QLL70340.1 cold shock domain-containing protein [Lactobacillus sp. 3B(2020)]
MEGTVKSFDRAKGWGFIEVPGEADIFVHTQAITPASRPLMQPGRKVNLVLVMGRRGWQAAHVKIKAVKVHEF